jgi:hypothetical protein
MAAFGPDGQPDFEAMWERSKQVLLEREPGLTKEAWIQRMREMREERMGGQPSGAPAVRADSPDGTRAEGATQQPAPAQTRKSAPSTSGIIKAGGEFYQGDYVLRPGMTAMVTIVVKQARGVLSVPNTALRFVASQYTKEAQAVQAQQRAQQTQQGGLMGGGPIMMFGPPQTQDRRARLADRGFATERTGRVWVLDEKGEPKAITVRPGLDSGNRTEITGEGISEGIEVLIGVDDAKKNASAPTVANPLAGGNQMGGGGRR